MWTAFSIHRNFLSHKAFGSRLFFIVRLAAYVTNMYNNFYERNRG